MVRLNIIILYRSIYVVHVYFTVVQAQMHHPANLALRRKTDPNTVG